MDVRLQRRVQRYGWDAAASIYEEAWRANLKPAHDLLFEMAAPAPGEHVADIACGSGLLAFRAADAVGAQGHVAANDISEEMMAIVAAEAARRGRANVALTRCGAEALGLPDETFDLALCGLGLMYVPEPPAALAEMHRVLKPGGRAAAAVWGARKNCGWADIFPIVDAEVRSEVCPLFFQLGSGAVLAESFARAGFAGIETRRIDATLDYPDAGRALAAMLDGGPVAMATKRFDAATRARVEAAYLDSIADHRTADGGYAIPGEFVVTLGRRPPAGHDGSGR